MKRALLGLCLLFPSALRADPAFDAFVDMKRLGDALAKVDVPGITDCALLLQHGEKVLLRNHPSLKSAKLFDLALNLALEKSDSASVQRLDKALRPAANPELLARLNLALQLSQKKRKLDPFAGQSASPEALAIYKALGDDIRLAKNLNDRNGLTNLKKTIDNLTELTADQRGQLLAQIDSSLTTAGAARAADPDEDFLTTLARTSKAKK